MQELASLECLELAHWWDLVPAATGAILGAAAAAIPSYMISQRSSKEVLKRDQAARLEEKKMSAHSAMMRMFSITNGLIGLEKYLNLRLEDSPQGEQEPDLWRYIPPQVGSVQEELLFSPDELAIFIEGPNTQFCNELWEISHRYIALEASFQKYCELREQFETLISAHGEGQILTSRLTIEEYNKLRPLMTNMDTLIRSIIKNVGSDYEQAKAICKAFREETISALNIEHFPSLHFD
jgi:hypothetical protein